MNIFIIDDEPVFANQIEILVNEILVGWWMLISFTALQMCRILIG